MRYRRPWPGPRRYKDTYGHTIIDGHTYLGRPRVPPLPNRISMRDRITGAEKVLSHTSTPGAILLVNIDPKWSDVTHYGSHDGPYDGDFRLFLDNGTLTAEFAAGHNSQFILTRKDFQTTVLRITVDQTNGAIVYTEYEL